MGLLLRCRVLLILSLWICLLFGFVGVVWFALLFRLVLCLGCKCCWFTVAGTLGLFSFEGLV